MADEEASLTKGAVLRLSKKENLDGETTYLQIQKVHQPTSTMGQQKFRLTVHDQQYSIDAFLSQKDNKLITNQELVEGSVIQLTKSIVNEVQGKALVIMLELEVLQKDCEPLGNPVPVPAAAPAKQSNSGFGSGGFGSKSGFGSNKSSGFGGGGFGQNTSGNQGGTSAGGEYQLLDQLSPFQKNFKIKVRCTRKGTMREWNNDRGSGKLFSVDLLDSQGTEIQATCFNDVADKFFPMFEEGKVYVMSKGRIKVANKRYTHIKNDYSIDMTMDTELEIASNDDSSIKIMTYEFKKLNELDQCEDKSYVDCCGIIDNIMDIQTFTSKRTQKELTKRSFRICDDSGAAVECTLWGDEATNFDPENLHQVVCCKAARVSEFNGKSLSVNKYQVNPEGVADAERLVQWWKSEGASTQFKSLTQSRGSGGKNEPPITLQEVENRGYGTTPDKTDYFNLKVTIEQILQDKDNGKFPWYKAVPEEEGPAYKVTEGQDGNDWWCEKNGKSYTSYKCRYVLRFRAADHTGSHFFNCYDESGQIILGMEAGEIEKFVDANDDANYTKVFENATYKLWNFRCRAKQDIYNDEARRRLDVVGATPITLKEDTHNMLNEISALM